MNDTYNALLGVHAKLEQLATDLRRIAKALEHIVEYGVKQDTP